MTRFRAILATLVLVTLLAAEIAAAAKVGPRLAQFLEHGDEAARLPKHATIRRSDGANEETTAVWVMFHAKCGAFPSIQELKPAALARRAKHGYGVTQEDRPICFSYKIAVEEALKLLNFPVSLRRESKWLNAVSYTIAISDLNRAVGLLESLPFVSELEIVGRLTRPTDALDAIGTHKSESEYLQSSNIRSATEEMELEHLHRLKRTNGKSLKRIHEQVEEQAEQALLKTVKESTVLSYGDSIGQLERITIPALHQLGLNGSGVIIAVLDTGFNGQHESLRDLTVVGAYDFVYNDTDVSDAGGEANHGTGTWSNIGGRMPGKLYGGSYGASFVLCKTEDVRTETSTEEDNFVRAIEFSEGLGADILSASLGYNGWLTWQQLDGKSSIIARAGQRAIDLGMLFVVANGNSGERGIGTPADMDRVLSVGALQPSNAIASFSSRGPTSDARVKPEVSAPGVAVKVAKWNDVTGYAYVSGTSFATPLTAGVAGLLLQSHPTWTNMQLRDAIMFSARPSGSPVPNIVFGWGIVDANAANSYSPSVASASQCVAPNGFWNSTTQSCTCNTGYYNTNCKSHVLACRDWCTGLCGSDGVCYCSGSISARCTSNSMFTTNPWTCSNSLYNDGSRCDCNCGRYDPDCDIADAPVLGCTALEYATCLSDNDRALCSYAPAEPTTPTDSAPTAVAKKESHYGILASLALAILTLFIR